MIASISSRYRNTTSKNMTAASAITMPTIRDVCRDLIASPSTWMAAKLPEMMRNKKGHRIRLTTRPDTSPPMMSANSSLTVGRSVNVKIVASSADQNRIKMKASHGTPGWKYCLVAQSSSAKGRVKMNLMNRMKSEPPSLSSPHSQLSTTTTNRTRPAQ